MKAKSWITGAVIALAMAGALALAAFSITLFVRAVSKPPAGDAHVMRGVEAYGAGDYRTAAAELEKALELGIGEHQPEQIYTVLGNAYDRLEEFDKAIACHGKAIELAPNYHSPWNGLGNVYRLQGKYDEAQKCYDEALRLKPDYPEGLASYGALCIFRAEPEKAIELLEQSIELDPGLPVARSNIALAYAMAGRFEDAESSLKTAVALGYPNGPVIRKRIDELKAIVPEK